MSYGAVPALRGVNLLLHRGGVVAVMGRNGAGKSSLLAALTGLRAPSSGTVDVLGLTPHAADPGRVVRAVGLVPQNPGDLLYAASVAAESPRRRRRRRRPTRHCAGDPGGPAPEVPDAQHPRDLSEGQRLSLALAVVLAALPHHRCSTSRRAASTTPQGGVCVTTSAPWPATGTCVILATHDVELVAEVATRVVVLADGEVVADGPTSEVVVGSPAFAPQVAEILAPQPWLTVHDVTDALEVAS